MHKGGPRRDISPAVHLKRKTPVAPCESFFYAPNGQKFVGEPQVLHLDIEVKPMMGWAWRPWDSNLIDWDQNTSILSFAYHWEHEGVTKVLSLRNFSGHQKDATNDEKIVRRIWSHLDRADIVVGQNIAKYDLPMLYGRFYHWDLGPTRPFLTIDTYKLFKQFRLDSNKLDSVSKQKGDVGKLKTHGKDTWLGCIRWDLKEWKLMEEYNKRDVDLELRRYKELLPWIPQRSNRRKPIICKRYET